MKKFYTLLTLCLAFFGIATATAQNAPEFSNEKAYTVKNTRSAWATSAERLNSITKLSLSENAADANQQFAFLTNDEGETYYLYSVGQQKFINNDGTLSATADFPIYFKKGNAEGTFVAYFDGSHHINIDNAGSVLIDGWSSADPGNSNVYTAVADFDPTEALKALPAPVVPEYPFIKSVSELSNNKLYTVVQKSHSKGATSWAIAAGGDAFVSSKQVEGAVVGQADDTKQQFAFLTYEEKIYLYHPAEKKFVNKDASLSATPVDAITLLDGAFKNTFMVKFDDSHYVNVNGEQNMGIDGWSAADGGNSCTISAVADFDPTEVLKLFVPVPTEIVGMTPVVGEVEAMPTTITLAFNNDIQALGVFQVMSSTSAGGDLMSMPDSYQINGKNLTLNLPGDFVAPLNDLTIVLQVMDTKGEFVSFSNSPNFAQPGMIFLYYTKPAEPVKSDVFVMESAEPAAGVVESLSEIYVTFNDPNDTSDKNFVGGFDTTKEVQLIDSWNDVVATATMEIVKDGKTNTKTAKFTLSDVITIADTYTLVIPEATVYNGRFYKYYEDFGVSYGATYNPEIRLEYTVVPPTEIVEITPTPGKISEMPSAINLCFSNEIKAVNVAVLQSTTVLEFPTPVVTIDNNVVTVNIPEEAANCQDLTVILQVVDAQGKNVTFSNHEFYGEQPGMIFLSYTVVPTAKVESIDPACGHYEEMPTSIKLTFTDEIKALEFGSLRTNATGFFGYNFTEEDYTIAGKELTLNLPESLVAGQPNLNITLSVVDVNDMYVTYASNPDYATEGYITLEYTAPMKSDLFAMESSDPAAGNVEKLDVINVTFGNPNYTPQFPGQTQIVGGIDATKEVAVVDAEGNVVTTATMEIVQANGWNSNTVKFTLAAPITEVGTYTLVIPAATVYNEMYDAYAEDLGVSWGAIYNPEVRIAYTIAAPDGINNITVNGNVEVYTLDGRKVKNPTKGIYVVNGKKVYVK